MKCLTQNKSIVANSLVWAAVILVTAFLAKGTDFAKYNFLLIVLGASFSHMQLTKARGKACCNPFRKDSED